MIVCIHCGQQHDNLDCEEYEVKVIQARADRHNMTGQQMAAIGLLQTTVDALFTGIEKTFPANDVFAIRNALLDVSRLTEIKLENIVE